MSDEQVNIRFAVDPAGIDDVVTAFTEDDGRIVALHPYKAPDFSAVLASIQESMAELGAVVTRSFQPMPTGNTLFRLLTGAYRQSQHRRVPDAPAPVRPLAHYRNRAEQAAHRRQVTALMRVRRRALRHNRRAVAR